MSSKKKKQYEEDMTERIESMENVIRKHKKDIEKIIENYEQKIEENERKNKKEIDNVMKKIEELETQIASNRNQNNIPRRHILEENLRSSNIEISKPVFYGNNKDQHPIDFLQNLEEYFKIKQMSKEEKLIIIRDCLKNTAGNWFATIKFQIREYAEFRNAFIDEFWSREIQIQTWSNCLNTSQVPNNITYREHFSQWSAKLRHLQVPQISEEEIVTNIASHYPGYLRAILISMPEKSIISAMKVLSAEEHRREKIESPNTENNYNNIAQRNNNNWRSQNTNQNNKTSNDYRRTRYNDNTQRSPNNQNYQNNQQNQEERVNQITMEQTPITETNDTTMTRHTINQIQTTNTSLSPYIKCNIEGEEILLLVDTGATISVLTKEVIDRAIHKNNKIPQLPISGVKISNAVGKQICKVTKQVFCECQIGDAFIFANFIQVDGLNEKGILGADILNKYDAQINFDSHIIQMKIEGEIHSIPFADKAPKKMMEEEMIQNINITEQEKSSNNILLSKEEKIVFDNLLNKYKEVFSKNPGRIKNNECHIRISKGNPIYQRPYPIPVSKITKVDTEIKRMLDLDIIEQSNSPWSSPIVAIEKKNGDIRVCIDARKVNTRIIPDRESPMNIDDIILKFQGAKYLSSIDLTAGYWQCQLAKNSREITAFLHKGRNFQFKVLPFGLVNSVAEFQKIIDKVLGPNILQFAAVYVDDIHIMSTSFEEHIYHLQMILNKFKEFNVTINMDKSQFFRSQVTFLGHIISEKGITMDPDKIQTIKNFQPPKNKKQIQSFLGFINFYRKYIKDLSKYTEVLSNLTKKGTTWTWENEQQTAFETIKEEFLQDIIMEYPDFKKTFFLNTDASLTHLGVELYQIDDRGRRRTIGFASRTLKDAERRYCTTELELLAIVFGCKKFRNYILGYETILLTDHKALTFLQSCQLLNDRLVRWAIKLQEYNLKIQYIPGKENIGADTLSRYPQSPEDQYTRKETVIAINKLLLTEYSKDLKEKFQRLQQLQKEDDKIRKLIQRTSSADNKYFIIEKGLLFIKLMSGQHRIMIPQNMSKQLIKETHEQYGHMGTFKIYQLLKTEYQFSNMYRIIKQFIRSCDKCQKAKVNNQISRGPMLSILPEEPLHIVSLDLIGPLPRGQGGAKYIVVFLDVFSKYIRLYPIKRALTDVILKKLIQYYIPKTGKMKNLLTDNGTQFTSHKWKTELQKNNIKPMYTTTYHPEGNPVERANREIGRILRTYCHDKHTNWVKWLDSIEYWINNTTHSTTGYNPNQILFGQRNTLVSNKIIQFPEQYEEAKEQIIEIVRKNLYTNAEKRKMKHDKGKKFPTYQAGQQILVKDHKLSCATDNVIHKFFLIYKGPYTITKIRDNNTVEIEDQQGRINSYNMKSIKRYYPPDPGETMEDH